MKTLLLCFLLVSQITVHVGTQSATTTRLDAFAANIAAERESFIENGWARQADGKVIHSVFVLVRNSSADDSDFSIVIMNDEDMRRNGFTHDARLPRAEAVRLIQEFREFEFDTVYTHLQTY